MPRHCPECSNELTKGVCSACGYGKRPAQDKDGQPLRCAYRDVLGTRCPSPGTISSSLKGGDFYCGAHIHGLTVFEDGIRTPPPNGFSSLKAILIHNRPPNDGSLIE
jgi:hypothetical protein